MASKPLRSFIVFLASAGFLVLLAPAANAKPPQPIDPGFTDGVKKTVNTSGIVVVSVMVNPSVDGLSANRRNVPVWVPAKTREKLCLRLQSIDGRYFGSGEYDLSQTESGRHIVSLKLSQPSVIKEYATNELVTDARMGADCSRRDRLKPIMASWQTQTSEPLLAIYVNTSGNSASLFIPAKSDPNAIKTVPCTRLRSSKAKRLYDSVCSVKMRADMDLDDMWVEVSRSGRRLFWEEVNLLTSDGVMKR